ncbi:MAG: hypothetical protein ACI9SE_002441 [Neolewinella sp.]|jgi:hypothetical protein
MRQRNLILLVVLVTLGACRFSDNQVTQTIATEHASELIRTISLVHSEVLEGMRVETISGDTVITHYNRGTVRRFILKDRAGYSGRIRLNSVDLNVGGAMVWIDASRLKVHGDGVTLDLNLNSSSSQKRFSGQDLMLDGDQVVPIGDGLGSGD